MRPYARIFLALCLPSFTCLSREVSACDLLRALLSFDSSETVSSGFADICGVFVDCRPFRKKSTVQVVERTTLSESLPAVIVSENSIGVLSEWSFIEFVGEKSILMTDSAGGDTVRP